MSVYFVKGKGKGWRYDFTLKGIRHTEAWFKTKTKAKEAEAKRREELKNPEPDQEAPTDMVFLDLVNLRLDHVKAYNSGEHYRSYIYMARRWSKKWSGLKCSEIKQPMVQKHLLQRRRISAYTANKDLRYLRATFNYGTGKKLISNNPTEGLDFFPVEKKIKYVPGNEDIDKVIAVADPDTQDYLWTILETMDNSRWPFRWVLFAGIFFFILSMGTEILDLFYKDYLEPEDGAPLFIVNVHRYILTYLSPFLWGGLGACVYLVKRLADARANLQFERQRFQGLSARIGLGALLGAVVVLIYGEENFTQSEFNLDANTLAFFVGVGVRVFYSLIESTIETVAEGLRRRITGETATHAAPKTDPKATATTDPKE